MSAPTSFRFRILRQDGPVSDPAWEEFEIPYKPGLNVVSALQEIQRNPVNGACQETTPVAFEASCVEEVCGSCTMLINGKVRQACSALVDHLIEEAGPVITLEPMTKFPVIRDLVVDRERLFEDLEYVKAWVPVDGSWDLGPGPRQNPGDQEWMYKLSTCMSCGCCLEACPNYNEGTEFVGAAVLSQVRLFNAHPTGALHKGPRLEAVMGEGGVTDCGNVQNCVKACPKHIPLTESIAAVSRQTTLHAVKTWLLG